MARSSISDDTALGWVSTSGCSPETVTISFVPAIASLNTRSLTPPTSTRKLGAICGDIPAASARAEYSPGGSRSNAKRPSESVITPYRMPVAAFTRATGCAVNPPARRIKHGAANRSSGGILGQSSCDEQENHADEAWHRADTWKWIKVSPDRGELGLYITDEAGRSVTARLFFSIRSRIGKLGRSDQYVLQLSVFRLCFLQNGDIRFSIFPKCKKVLIGFAALGRVAGESVSLCTAHVRKCISGSYRS